MLQFPFPVFLFRLFDVVMYCFVCEFCFVVNLLWKSVCSTHCVPSTRSIIDPVYVLHSIKKIEIENTHTNVWCFLSKIDNALDTIDLKTRYMVYIHLIKVNVLTIWSSLNFKEEKMCQVLANESKKIGEDTCR